MTTLGLDRLLYTGILESKDSSIRLEGSKVESAECNVTIRNITGRYCEDIVSDIFILFVVVVRFGAVT